MKPTIHPSTYISEDATLLGDVVVEEGVNIWPHASVRADLNRITIRKGANIQDCCVIHVTRDYDTQIGENVSVGHGAVVHGAHIGENSIIGMNATVLDGAKIGKNCLIGANALVRNGMEIPDNSLVVGVPANILKQDPSLGETTIRNAQVYHILRDEHLAGKHGKYQG